MYGLKNLNDITSTGFYILTALLLSCSDKTLIAIKSSHFESKPEFKAPDKISRSFHYHDNMSPKKRKDKNLQNKQDPDTPLPALTAIIDEEDESMPLAIRASSLNKEFLLRTNIVEGSFSPEFHGLKTRIVAFTRKGEKIYMLQAEEGHVYYKDLPQRLILAEFSILDTEDDLIYFDFNEGMSYLYTQDEHHYQDFNGSEPPDYEEQFNNDNISKSYIERIEFAKNDDHLYIWQVAQINRLPVQIRYSIEPYRPAKGFRPTVSSKRKEQFAFFEAHPMISEKTKKTVVYATKFNINKPIIFYLSSNTPGEYEEAVRDGILYWNKAFGQEVLQVRKAPPTATAPDYKRNIVQWINWNDASFAYADSQTDPRTGEVLNAQIYLSSVFAVHSKEMARNLLRIILSADPDSHPPLAPASNNVMKSYLKTAKKKGPKKAYNGPFSANFDRKILNKKSQTKRAVSEPLCQMNGVKKFAMSLNALLARDVPDQVYLKISQDHIRETVAHEVGHLLGLRHNFAGSLASSYTLPERDRLFEQYIKNQQTPQGTVITSSVMGYTELIESAMAGDQIKRLHNAFSHDELAIKKLYFHKDPEPAQPVPLFCTDSHLGQFVDCNEFNLNASPLEYSKWAVSRQINEFANALAEYFISTVKAVGEGEEKLPLHTISATTTNWALQLLGPRSKAIEALNADSRSLAIERSYDWFSEVHQEEARSRYTSWIHEELKKHGDGKWERIMDHIPEDFSSSVIGQFDRLISSEQFKKGSGPQGGWEFSDAEIGQMKQAVRKYMPKMEQALRTADILQLLSFENISGHHTDTTGESLDIALSSYLYGKVRHILTATTRAPGSPEKHHNIETVLRKMATATILESNPKAFRKKIAILKQLIDKKGILNFFVDDKSPGKHYDEEELNIIAGQVLNQTLELAISEQNRPEGSSSITKYDTKIFPVMLDSSSYGEAEFRALAGEEELPPEDLSINGQLIKVRILISLPIVLPRFQFEPALRVLATNLLSGGNGESVTFGLSERLRLSTFFTNFFLSHIRGEKPTEQALIFQARELLRYIKENEGIITAIDSM